MKSEIKARKLLTNILIYAGKTAVVAALIGWLVFSGKLSWSSLGLLLTRYDVVIFNALLWVLGSVFLNSLRWLILVRGLGWSLSVWDSLRFNMIGLFFNSVMPGAVGGDLIKAFYLYRNQGRKGPNSPLSHKLHKTPAMLSVLLDRLIGLYSVFFLCLLAMAASWQKIIFHGLLNSLSWLAVILFTAMSCFFLLAILPLGKKYDPLAYFFSLPLPGNRFFKKIYQALTLYRQSPLSIVYAVILGLFYQLFYLGFFIYVAYFVTGTRLPTWLVATILPFGGIAIAIPLAPGGLGVGHLAYEHLFSLVGIQGGANIFNIVFVGQLLMNLLGAIPYLFQVYLKEYEPLQR